MSRKISTTENEDSYALEARIKTAFGTQNLKRIAKALGVSYPGLNHLLRGHRRLTVDLVRKISDLTGYSIHWLVTGKGPSLVDRGEGEAIRDWLLERLVDMKYARAEDQKTERRAGGLK